MGLNKIYYLVQRFLGVDKSEYLVTKDPRLNLLMKVIRLQ